MRIPKKIQVGGIVYDIEFKKPVCEVEDSRDGLIFPDKQKMVIESGMGEDYTKYVFLHELLHAMFYQIGFCPDEEEDIVTKLAHKLLQVIKDNPDMWK